MKILSVIAAVLFAASVHGADQVYAIIQQSTNVWDVWSYDPDRPPTLPSGSIAVQDPPSYVTRGWRYVAPNWFQPDGSPPPEKLANSWDRKELIRTTILDLQEALSSWDKLSAGQQKAVLKRLTQIVLIMLYEERIQLKLEED